MTYVGSSWVEIERWSDATGYGNYAEWRVQAYSTQDTAANTSVIYFRLQKSVSANSAYSYDSKSFKITGTGAGGDGHSATQSWSYGSVSDTSWQNVGGDTSDMYWSGVKHNSEGRLSLTANATGGRVMGGTFDTDISIELPTIARASIPTAEPNPAIIGANGRTVTIKTNRKSTSFKHTVKIECGSWSWQSSARAVADSVAVVVPYEVISRFSATSKTATATVTCWTYSGTTEIGRKTCTLTLQVDPNVDHPNIGTVTIEDTNEYSAAIEASGTLILNASNLKATIPLTVSGSYTELASAVVRCGNDAQTFILSGTSQTIVYTKNKIDTNGMVITVYDKRGNSAVTTQTWGIVEYSDISVTGTVVRTSETGDTVRYSLSGQCFAGSFGQATNTLTIQYKSKANSNADFPENWTTLSTVTPSGSGTTDYGPIEGELSGYDYTGQYNFIFRVYDLFTSAETRTLTVTVGIPVYGNGRDFFAVYGNQYLHYDRSNPSVFWDLNKALNGILAHDGVKNLTPMTTATKTENGVTFTNNSTYYNVNGTATSNAFCNASTTNSMETGKRYILSGLHDEWQEGMLVQVRYAASTDIIATAEKDDVEFTCPAPCYIYLVVRPGTTVNNKRWYPMVRDADIASEDYVRYAPSNQVLNESISSLNSLLVMRNYTWSGSWSNSSSAARNLQITGKGIVIINCYVRNGGTADTGQCDATITLRNTSNVNQRVLAASANRVSETSGHQISANAATAWYYDGSTADRRLYCAMSCTKNGTNSWRIEAVTIGCTLAVV